MRLRALVLAALLTGMPGYAHQDTVVAIEADGTLVGLPTEFEPAKLSVHFSPGIFAPKVSDFYITLGRQSRTVPGCITRYIHASSLRGARAYASWYHDGALPPYLEVEFPESDGDATAPYRNGIRFVFNLRTARVIGITVVRVSGAAVWLDDLPPRYSCEPWLLDAFLEDHDPPTRLIVKFGSVCCGPDGNALSRLMETVDAYERRIGRGLARQTVPWGIEGDFTICFRLDELDATMQGVFVRDVKGALRSGSAKVEENMPCRPGWT
jgi:hypothetical protein